MKVLDFHNHVGPRGDPWIFQTANALEKTMDEYGIGEAVIFPFFDGKASQSYSAANKRVRRIAARNPRCIPFLRVAPNTLHDAIAAIGNARQAGFKGIKMHPPSDLLKTGQAERLIRVMQDCSLPVLIHFWDNLEKTWYEIFKKYTATTFVIAHGAGFNHLPLAVKLAECLPNVFIETSLIISIGMQYLLQHLDAKKIIYGSDSPFSHPYLELEKIRFMTTRAQQRLIFYENGAQILNR
jgi:predicted TIM-barrel fold metal-dependent hydrolase